jgi:hypothetical protein
VQQQAGQQHDELAMLSPASSCSTSPAVSGSASLLGGSPSSVLTSSQGHNAGLGGRRHAPELRASLTLGCQQGKAPTG